MSNNKVKDNKVKGGLLKGFRYISHIFESEKEQEIEIGFPTDVKHVAHIGWDGPSVNTPTWMNEFKSSPSPGLASAPLNLNGDINKGTDDSVKWVSDDTRRGSRSTASNSQARDLPELPKSSRRQSTGSVTDSPSREKSDKPRSRRPSKPKDSTDGSRSTRKSGHTDSLQGSESPARSIPDVPKKTRRKKSKDTSTNIGSASKLRVKAQTCASDSNSDLGSPSGSIKSRSSQLTYDEE
ncbi:hypothetical protein L6164_009964 [Bauhinia variegata]|uniref:Uncharacterized protein n=1 Tax=Bauhinia variegata TaxID=167791 RepID=A0ACB9PLH9_BAUVA|nr:hypothetical protein L6164_009964 [Bauhinia variegata]